MNSPFSIANKHYEQYDYQKATYLYAKCIETKFHESDCLNNLANTYCQSYLFSIHQYVQGVTQTHQQIGEYKKALNLYERAIEIEPNHFEAHFNLGVHLFRMDFERAFSLLSKAVSLNPDDVIARFHLAKCKEELIGEDFIDKEGAVEEYSLAIELDPTKLEPLLARASLYQMLNQYELARSDFDRAVDLFPEMDEAYLERGKVKLEDGNLEGALIDFSKGLSINSKSWPLYSHRSYVFNHLAKKVAIEEFSVLAQEDKKDSTYYFNVEQPDCFDDNVQEFVPDSRLRQCE